MKKFLALWLLLPVVCFAQLAGGLSTKLDPRLGANGTGSSAATASTPMVRDAVSNVAANSFISNFTSTATAAGTTTLTVASSQVQEFTGSSTQTVKLPDATTLTTGKPFTIFNKSTGTVTVQDSGGNTLVALLANSEGHFVCANVGSANGSWDAMVVGYVTSTSGGATFSGTLTAAGALNVNASQLSSLFLGTGGSNSLNGKETAGVTVQNLTTTAWTAAATTQDIVIAVLPAKTRLRAIVADTTVAYAGLSGTIQLQVGTSTGGTELLLAHDVKTATITKGLLDADLGASMTRAAMVQGGFMGSWTGNTNISVRLTSGSGNIGTGAATNLTTGTTKFYLYVEGGT